MRNLILSTILILWIAITSCNPVYYTPTTQNVPLMSEKGEIDINFAFYDGQYELQGAYAITDKFAVQANGGYYLGGDTSNGGNGQLYELGFGHYSVLSKGEPSLGQIIYETYGLIGYGRVNNYFSTSLPSNPDQIIKETISANLLRIGVQPNIGFKSKYLSAIISTRIAVLGYHNIHGNIINNNSHEVNYLKANATQLVFEPAFTFRIGFEKIKIQWQLGYSSNLTNKDFKQDDILFTLGFNVKL